jgi:hypothetical protein
MAQTICVIISAAERERLQAIVGDRNRPQKHVERAGIVLASADRGPAQQVGLSLRSVQRIWQSHQLQPHRIRTFKHSRDPAFAAKLTDIVGLYVDPPVHAVVLSLDEKSPDPGA